MRSRTPAALVLAALLAAALSGHAPAAGQAPKDKEPSKEPTKPPTPKWPREIGGKDMNGWLKDLNDPDPAIREAALRTIPNFGPDVQKPAGKLLVARLKAEKDPGVRITAFATIATIGFDKSDANEEKEALRVLGSLADESGVGSATRQQAIQALGAFGPRAYNEVGIVAGRALNDTSYETRRIIANTLGRIGFSETVGPSHRATVALSGTLARDVCVSVRMESLQSLVLLGPPWAAVRKPGDKTLPPISQKDADITADNMRHRLGMSLKGGPAGKELEPDKQLQIWCRVVLMRFDPKEINPANLAAIAKNIDPKGELGPKVQALQALALFGERAEKQVDDVVKVLDDSDPLVLSTALQALGAMGVKAQGAIPELEKAEKKWEKMRDERMKENLKDPKFTEFYNKLKPEEKEKAITTLPEEQARLSIVETIKWIKKSKPGLPGGDPPADAGTGDKAP